MFNLDQFSGIWIFLSVIVFCAYKLLVQKSSKETSMPEPDKAKAYVLIKKVEETCIEIRNGLENELEKARTKEHINGWQKDIVTINNTLFSVATAKEDIANDIIGKSLEFNLRRAAYDSRKEFVHIPFRRDLHENIFDSFDELQKMILFLISKHD